MPIIWLCGDTEHKSFYRIVQCVMAMSKDKGGGIEEVIAAVVVQKLPLPAGSSERHLGCDPASNLIELRASVNAGRSQIGWVS